MNPFKDKAPINIQCNETNKTIKSGQVYLSIGGNAYCKDSFKYREYQNLPFRGSSWVGEEREERSYSNIDY